jgi:hypothetical protein
MNLKSDYADELAALAAQVHALGGNKLVGCQLWPDKTAESAQKLMSDCCNDSRSQRLSPSQLLMVMRLGREADVHILPEYLLAHSGYERPIPVTPEDEEKELLHSMSQLMTRMEKLQAMGKKKGRA